MTKQRSTSATKKIIGGRLGIDYRVKVMACLCILKTDDLYERMKDGARMSEDTLHVYLRKLD